jgi:hypothetical protein
MAHSPLSRAEIKTEWSYISTSPICLYCMHRDKLNLFFPVAQQPNSGLGRLAVEVSRSHSIRNTHSVGLLWTSDQPVAEAANYTAHNKHKT